MMRGLVLALVALGFASAALAVGWESPDFAAAISRPKRIAILPAQASMTRARVNDAVPFVKETKILEDTLRSDAAQSLRALGYDADVDSLSMEKLSADPQLHAMVRALETRVAGIIDVAEGRPRDINRGRFSVGEDALPLQRATGADGFLWLQSSSIVPSKGQRALGSIFTVLTRSPNVPTNHSQLVAFLLDAHTGELASVAIGTSGGPVVKEPDRVAQHMVEEVFAQWPAFTVARKVSEKRVAASAAAVKPPAPSAAAGDELDAIARFEDAAARLEGQASAGLPESVDAHDEFTNEGAPIAAANAPVAEPEAVPAPPAPAPAPTSAPAPEPKPPGLSASTTNSSSTTNAPTTVDPKLAWARPAVPAQRQVVLQMVAGTPGVTVRNSDGRALLVSVDLAPWTSLLAGEERAFDVGPGSHRILVASPDGSELARANVLVSSSRANAEILPQ